MAEIYNFSSGPAMIPKEVLEKAKSEIFNYKRTGVGVMELGENSKEVKRLISKTEKSLRKLLGIPDSYKILFLSGSATAQFSAIPLNLLSSRKCADYVVSGQHSRNAYLEAKKYGDIVIAASSAGALPAYSTVPEIKCSDFRPDADYIHLCYNDAVYGTTFRDIPDMGNIPLVADMSSYLLSEPFDVSKFSLIYASSQQNMGPAGMTLVILRENIIGSANELTPSNIDYKSVIQISQNKLKNNTPPIWNIYMAGLILDWIASLGGLEEIKRRNERRASLVYDYLDSQSYYVAPVDKKFRSTSNIIFMTGNAELDKKFVEEAEDVGLINLSGDSSIGGMCASMYNAMPIEGTEKLVAFMKEFASQNPKIDA